MKAKVPPPKRTWVFALAVTAAVAGYVLLFFFPGQRATANLRRELEEQLQFVKNCEALPAQIAATHAELARTREFVHAWKHSAPTEHRLAHLFVDITRRAEVSQTQIVRFDPQPVDKMARLDRIPLELACEGTFAALFQFLKGLEELDADVWIELLDCQPVAVGSSRLRCELRLSLFADQPENSD